MKLTVETLLCSSLTVENCSSLLSIARNLTAPQLFEASVDFFHRNRRAVKATGGWKDEIKDNSELVEVLLSRD